MEPLSAADRAEADCAIRYVMDTYGLPRYHAADVAIRLLSFSVPAWTPYPCEHDARHGQVRWETPEPICHPPGWHCRRCVAKREEAELALGVQLSTVCSQGAHVACPAKSWAGAGRGWVPCSCRCHAESAGVVAGVNGPEIGSPVGNVEVAAGGRTE